MTSSLNIHLNITIQCHIFPSVFPTKILCASLMFPLLRSSYEPVTEAGNIAAVLLYLVLAGLRTSHCAPQGNKNVHYSCITHLSIGRSIITPHHINCLHYVVPYTKVETWQWWTKINVKDIIRDQDEDGQLLGRCAVKPRKNWPTFQRRIPPQPSRRWFWYWLCAVCRHLWHPFADDRVILARKR